MTTVKRKHIIMLATLCIMIALIVAVGSTAQPIIAYADDAMVAAGEFNFVLYEKTNALTTGAKLGFGAIKDDYSQATGFEYVINLQRYWDGSQEWNNGANFYQSPSTLLEFIIEHKEDTVAGGSSTFLNVMLGEYNPSGYPINKSLDLHGDVYDNLYIVYTPSFVKICGTKLNADDISLDAAITLFSFANNSAEYNSIKAIMESSAATVIPQADIKETIKFYKTVSALEEPVKEGYTFTGWYYDAACTRPYDGAEVTEDLNLYAGWQINKYTVRYYPDGLQNPDIVQEIEYGKVASYTPDPRPGYTFDGWFFEDGSKYNNYSVKSDMKLIGRWTAVTYTITFDSNGGSSVASQTVPHGSVINAPIPTREGYTFIRWEYTSPNGVAYVDQPITSNLTLRAHWEKSPIITFDSNGGNTIEPLMIDYGSAPIFPEPVRAGYVCEGWFLPDGTRYLSQPFYADCTLTAQWHVAKCRITFYVDDEIFRQITVDYGTSLLDAARNLVEPTAIRSYRFMNLDVPVQPLENVIIVDDAAIDVEMSVASDPTVKNSVVAFLETWKIPFIIGGSVLVALIIVAIVLIVKKVRGAK